VKEARVTIVAGEPTQPQLLAWKRLWALVLAPADSMSPARLSECALEPETATPGGQGRAGARAGRGGVRWAGQHNAHRVATPEASGAEETYKG